MNYKVESDFNYCGYRCVVVMHKSGHRCGYVGVPTQHPLYGVDYGQKVEILKFSSIKDQPIGKRGIIPVLCSELDEEDRDITTPELYFNVHGGITYADCNHSYPVESDLWWFGFDCAHCEDANDYDSVIAYGLDTEENVNRTKALYGDCLYVGEIRTQRYVEAECMDLASQLWTFEK